MQTAIQVTNLSKRFSPKGPAVMAVDGISFEVKQGSFTALLGGNGAGKTTTIAMLLGLVTPSGGHIEIFGKDFAKFGKSLLARMNFQSPYVDLPRRLTVRQNLLLYARLYGVKHPRAHIETLAKSLDLSTLLDRPLGELSAGQRTRAGLAKALVNTPELVLLDEPTASLDPDTAHWIRDYLSVYAKDNSATFLIASHNMFEVERLCSDVLMMRQGRIVDQGAPQSLLEKYGRTTLEDVFLDIARAGRAPDGVAP